MSPGLRKLKFLIRTSNRMALGGINDAFDEW